MTPVIWTNALLKVRHNLLGLLVISSRVVTVSAILVSFFQNSALALVVGDRVRANASTVNVRSTPAGSVLGSQSNNALGTIIGGPQTASLNGTSFVWWQVNWDIAPDGWSVQDFLVASNADIIVENLAVNPTSGLPGSNSTVSYTVRNQGVGTSAPSTTNIRLAASGSSVTTNDLGLAIGLSTPQLASGSTHNVSQSVTIPNVTAGSYFVWVILDVNHTAGQGPVNEGNDRVNVPFTVLAPPQLSGVAVSLNFGDVQVGSCSPAVVAVQHVKGTAPASGSVSVSPNPPFSLTGSGSFSLSNGSGTDIGVQFCPTSAGQFSGSAIVSSPGSTFLGGNTVALSGRGTNPAPTVGVISMNATLNGAPWTGSVNYTFNGPASFSGNNVPTDFQNRPAGSYTLSYTSGGPTGATLSSITTSATQTLAGGGVITFSLNFTANSLLAPSNLVATPISTSGINLIWNDNSNNETAFKVERKLGTNGTFSQIGTQVANSAFFNDLTLNATTEYCYRVRATNGVLDSAYSSESCATTQGAGPAAPSNLVATQFSASGINLIWNDNSNNETAFKIERKLGTNGTFSQIGTQAANFAFLNDLTLNAATEYCYRVRANNSNGDSAYSNESCATTQGATGPPTLISPGTPSAPGQALSTLRPRFSWNEVSGVTGYGLVIREEPQVSTVYATSLPLGATVFDLPSGQLLSGKTYSWVMTSFAGTTQSAESPRLYFQTQCPVGTLSGTVRDATTNVRQAGVTVILSGASAVTDGSGFYSFTGRAPATYALSSAPVGYVPYNQSVALCGDLPQDILLTKPATVQGPNTASGYGPDPVNTATGNYIYQRKDLEIPGKGIPFVFERNYNSQDPQPGPLGYGWTHNLNTSLLLENGNVIIRWGDGKTETYAPDGSGGFTPQYGVFDTLIQNAGETYSLKKKTLTSYNFNSSNKLASIVDKNGNTISSVYAGGNLTQVTDTAGRNITFIYDGNNRITIITDPIGRTVQFTYDAAGDLATSRDMNGKVTTFTYDNDHQILTVTDPRSNVVATNVYDASKRVVTSQKDAKLGETRYVYDAVNRHTTITDALLKDTHHFYDELLRLIEERDPLGNSTFYTYDDKGNRTSVTDKNGYITRYEYDDKGNVLKKTDPFDKTTTITYDTNNNPLTRTDPLQDKTVFIYDLIGNLLSVKDPLEKITSYTYKPGGLLKTVTDARNNPTTNTYDAQGNLIRVTDALGKITEYTPDGVGRRLTATDPPGHRTTYAYDNNNNLLSVTNALNEVTRYEYDENNNRRISIDPMGKTTTFIYDVKDLLTTTIDPLDGTLTYTYDALDRKIAVKDKNDKTTTYDYDPVGNLIQITDAAGKISRNTYDANGNRRSTIDPNDNKTEYLYDKLNRVISVKDALLHETRTTYDDVGRVKTTRNANDQTTQFEYDPVGRLAQVTDADVKTVLYSYDENGNRTSVTDPNNKTTQFTYDKLNRLISKNEPLTETRYTYDDVGNRKTMSKPDGSIINYTYDVLNRLENISYPDKTTVTFTYDGNGNRIRMTDSLGTSTYEYDALNRMTSYSNPFNKTIGYGYELPRVSRTVT